MFDNGSIPGEHLEQ